MAGVRVAVALDREHRRALLEPDGRLEALVLGAPQARRQHDVAELVKLVVLDVARAVLGDLAAEQLGGARVVLVKTGGSAENILLIATTISMRL